MSGADVPDLFVWKRRVGVMGKADIGMGLLLIASSEDSKRNI